MRKISLFINNVTQPIDEYEPIDVTTLDILQDIPDTSCDAVYMNDTLDYVENKELLRMSVIKLAYGGEVIIIGTDLQDICDAFSQHKISLEEMHNAIYKGRINTWVLENCVELLQKFGLKIIKAVLNNGQYMVIAQRPANDN